MPEISIHTVDQLHMAFTRLETVTYLEALALEDACEEYIFSDDMKIGKENAAHILLDLQREAVADLHRLLFAEPFGTEGG